MSSVAVRRLMVLAGLGCLFMGGASLGLLLSSGDAQAPASATVFEEPLQLPELESAASEASTDAPEAVMQQDAIEARLRIPRLGVDAPIVALGVRSGGVMESPATPDVVGWYSFSAKPGDTGNAVFAGHRDYGRGGPAVFGALSRALSGDEIVVALEGEEYRYRVVRVDSYEATTAPVGEIVGSSNGAYLTLITCTGEFDSSTGRYEQRLVVRAAQVGGSEQGRAR